MTHWRGHDRQIVELIGALDAGRFHHGWIFAGPAGLGKAGIAYDFAKRLLVAGGTIEQMSTFGNTVAGAEAGGGDGARRPVIS